MSFLSKKRLGEAFDAAPLARSPRRNLVIVRASDSSLHPHWLVGAAAREWDLHISYFGDRDKPAADGLPGVTWSKDGGKTKWTGYHACLQNRPVDPQRYDFIATPDDDLLMSAADLNRAFAMARRFNLALCQPSLNSRSFYSHGLTIHRSGLLLRYVDVVETMAPIFRQDVFARAEKLFADPDNSWGFEYVVAASLRDQPQSMAILDTVAVLHTRAHGISKMYQHLRESGAGRTMADAEFDYLAKHGVTKYERRALSALRADGSPARNMSWVRRAAYVGRFWNLLYKLLGLRNIAPRPLS